MSIKVRVVGSLALLLGSKLITIQVINQQGLKLDPPPLVGGVGCPDVLRNGPLVPEHRHPPS